MAKKFSALAQVQKGKVQKVPTQKKAAKKSKKAIVVVSTEEPTVVELLGHTLEKKVAVIEEPEKEDALIAMEEKFVMLEESSFSDYQIKQRTSFIVERRLPMPMIMWHDERRERLLMRQPYDVIKQMLKLDMITMKEFVKYKKMYVVKEAKWEAIRNETDLHVRFYNYTPSNWLNIMEAFMGEGFDQYGSNF